MATGRGQGLKSEASQLENLKAVTRMVPGGHSWPFPTTIHQPHRLCLTLVQDRPGLKGRIASGSRQASQGAAQTSGLSFHIWRSASFLSPIPSAEGYGMSIPRTVPCLTAWEQP